MKALPSSSGMLITELAAFRFKIRFLMRKPEHTTHVLQMTGGGTCAVGHSPCPQQQRDRQEKISEVIPLSPGQGQWNKDGGLRLT